MVMTSGPNVMYVAAPVSGNVNANLARAMRWLRWLRARDTDAVYIAPWIASILSGEDDSDPAQRERGLRDCVAVVSRCDAVVLVGGRVSSGMQREREAIEAKGGVVIDLTYLGEEPPV